MKLPIRKLGLLVVMLPTLVGLLIFAGVPNGPEIFISLKDNEDQFK